MKRLQVAFVSYFYTNTFMGGGAIYTLKFCQALTEFADVTIIIPKIHRGKIVWKKGINYILCDNVDLPFLRALTFSLFASKEVNLEDFDIIHSNETAGIFFKKLDVVTFYHKTDGVTPWSYSSYLMQRTCLKKAKVVVAVSERAREELAKMGFGSKGISVVHLGVDYASFNPGLDRDECKDILNLERKKVLLYIGSEGMSKRKNMLLLLKLMKKVRDLDLLLIVAPKSDERRFLKLAKKYGVANRVRYDGIVPHKLLPCYYSASDFLLCPSIKEGFGLTLLEAISSGKPFVSMDVGIAPMLSEKGFGYVANNEEDFIEKCALMLADPLRVGWRGNEFVKENFSWRECAKKTTEVYEKLC